MDVLQRRRKKVAGTGTSTAAPRLKASCSFDGFPRGRPGAPGALPGHVRASRRVWGRPRAATQSPSRAEGAQVAHDTRGGRGTRGELWR